MKRFPHPLQGAFTMVEALVVLAIMGILLAVAAPAFDDFVRKKRLEGVTQEFVADINHAKSISATLQHAGVSVFMNFDAARACYTMYVDTDRQVCDCTKPFDQACPKRPERELKTALMPKSGGVKVVGVPSRNKLGEGFVMANNQTVVFSDSEGLSLQVTINRMGHVKVCSLNGKFLGYSSCAGS